MKLKHNPKITKIAKKLRTNMTKQESMLWYMYLKKYPIRILRQKVIDRFVVDFYCAKAKIAIEIDGYYHSADDVYEYDKMRTELLSHYGIKVIRFTNEQVENNISAVCNEINEEIQKAIN